MIDHETDCASLFDYSRGCNCGALDAWATDERDKR